MSALAADTQGWNRIMTIIALDPVSKAHVMCDRHQNGAHSAVHGDLAASYAGCLAKSLAVFGLDVCQPLNLSWYGSDRRSPDLATFVRSASCMIHTCKIDLGLHRTCELTAPWGIPEGAKLRALGALELQRRAAPAKAIASACTDVRMRVCGVDGCGLHLAVGWHVRSAFCLWRAGHDACNGAVSVEGTVIVYTAASRQAPGLGGCMAQAMSSTRSCRSRGQCQDGKGVVPNAWT